MRRPYCVALTGGIGSGKTRVADIFAGLGVAVIDTDRIARDLTAPGGQAMAAILGEFGAGYVLPDGSLDRRRMREAAFRDPDVRRRLESVLHPRIRDQAARMLADAPGPYAILVVPLLVESGAYGALVDRVLVVDCDPAQQIERIMKRDGIGERMAAAMLAAQAGREKRVAKADDIVDSRGYPAFLDGEVRRLQEIYLVEAAKLPR